MEWDGSEYLALVDLETLEAERIHLISRTFHLVRLRQNSILEEFVGREEEFKFESHWFFFVVDLDVSEMFQDGLIMFLDHIS